MTERPAGGAEETTGAEGAYPAPAPDTPVQETLDIHRLLISSVRDYAIFVLDPRGHVLTWNPGAERLKGYAPHEIIGKHFSVFYPNGEGDRPHTEYELRMAEEEGRYQEEGWRVRKDGTRFWANVLITALREEDGTLVGFAKVTRDLTERKLAEEAVRRSEERFRLLVHSVRDYGIFMLDPDGTIAGWNEGAERIKGYTAEEIIGKHFSIFYPPEDLAAGKPEMELRMVRRDGRFEDEGWRLRKDGTRFWANVVITALRNDAGELIGFAKVTRDLTDRRAAELKAIEDARRVARAEAANRTKSEFLAAMSHELRTPLNAIGGYVDLLTLGVHGPVNEAQADALERVRKGQRHLLALINDLLNFSRIEAGQVTYTITPVSLTELVAAVRPLIEPQAYARDIRLVTGRNPSGITAAADRSRAEQILLNLLTNAVKFTQPGGTITVREHAHNDRAIIEVEDTGIGIPENMLEEIFEPFTQVGRSLTSAHEGTGLGLAISRDLARGMNGDLTVRSQEGVGSVFALILPLASPGA